MSDVIRRRELAEFLRSRRERLTPAEVGLIATGRRKTPGLRREEVADLAGLGLAWYTWLEQARPIKVSESVLWAIARALRLSSDERNHLLRLGSSNRPPRDLRSEQEEVDPANRAVLDGLNPFPAHIRDEYFNLLAWNEAFEKVWSASEIAASERNLIWMFFTSERVCEVLDGWEKSASDAVAEFRFDCSSRIDHPEVQRLIARLHDESPVFKKLWRQQVVCSGVGSTVRWRLADDIAVLDRTVYLLNSKLDPGLVQGPRLRLAVHIPRPGSIAWENVAPKPPSRLRKDLHLAGVADRVHTSSALF